MGRRVLWYLAGTLAAEAVTLVLCRAFGWHHFPDFSVVVGALAVVYGEKTGRLEKIEHLTRPLTLFDGKVPRT